MLHETRAYQAISIHAPRTGSDAVRQTHLNADADFNPRSPHGERRAKLEQISIGHSDFNPRSPHGERQSPFRRSRPSGRISIHAPRTGSDPGVCEAACGEARFQSTLPARGATRRASRPERIRTYFNPRSPHGERQSACRPRARTRDFNPRSPHGERPVASPRPTAFFSFQSTLPARGAT